MYSKGTWCISSSLRHSEFIKLYLKMTKTYKDYNEMELRTILWGVCLLVDGT